MFLKKFIHHLCPPIFIKFIIKLRNTFLINFYYNQDIYKNNKKLKLKRKKKRAFLIATGPSLKMENLKLLRNEDCFTLSNAFLLKNIHIINPIMHFFAPYHKPITQKSFYNWLNQADKKLPNHTSIILSHNDKKFLKNKLFKKREIFYLNITRNVSKFHSDITKAQPKFQSGSIMVIPVLMYMGYKQIYLLGCDHNQLKNFNSIINNFYDEKLDVRYTKKKKN